MWANKGFSYFRYAAVYKLFLSHTFINSLVSFRAAVSMKESAKPSLSLYELRYCTVE
jgi:hypothetical protein